MVMVNINSPKGRVSGTATARPPEPPQPDIPEPKKEAD